MKKTVKKTLKIPIYFWEISLIKTDDFKDMERKFDFPEDSMNWFWAVTFTDHDKSWFTKYVMIFSHNWTVKDIWHECIHCLRYMYQDRWIEFVNGNNDEHQAYLMWWLVWEVHKFLTKK